MVKIKDITQYLEQFAPLDYQESYDNCGLITGNDTWEVTGILISLDCTEAVVEEAIREKCNLIVAHHPIWFSPIKKLTGRTYVERTIIKSIKHDVAIYAIHTNLDNVSHGVNKKIADRIQLTDVKVLKPKSGTAACGPTATWRHLSKSLSSNCRKNEAWTMRSCSSNDAVPRASASCIRKSGMREAG